MPLFRGATFTGPFTLPARRGPGWITIRSSRLRALQRGRRVRRRDARHMPRLPTPGRGLPVLMTAPRASGWRLAGLELASNDPGATDPAIPGLVPTDIVIRRNLIRKPPAWRGRWTVKNLLELESARRERIEDNVPRTTGPMPRTAPRSCSPCATWTVGPRGRRCATCASPATSRRVGRGLNLLGHDDGRPSGPTRDVLIEDNVFRQVGYRNWGDGVWMVSTDVARLRVERNTVFNEGSLLRGHGAPNLGFRMLRNITRAGPFGIKGDGRASGLDTLRAYFSGSDRPRQRVRRRRRARVPARQSVSAHAARCGSLEGTRAGGAS